MRKCALCDSLPGEQINLFGCGNLVGWIRTLNNLTPYMNGCMLEAKNRPWQETIRGWFLFMCASTSMHLLFEKWAWFRTFRRNISVRWIRTPNNSRWEVGGHKCYIDPKNFRAVGQASLLRENLIFARFFVCCACNVTLGQRHTGPLPCVAAKWYQIDP